MGKIYLLETNLYTKEGHHVYKLGRSDQIGLKRLRDYEKDYEIVMIIACNDSVKIEAELIKLFIQKYKKHLKNEYFVGNKHQMMDDIIEIVRNERVSDPENLKSKDDKWLTILENKGVPVMLNRSHIRIPSPDLFSI